MQKNYLQTLQLLLQIPDFVQAYGTDCEKHFLNVAILDSHNDFNCQMAKVFSSLSSGEFSQVSGLFIYFVTCCFLLNCNCISYFQKYSECNGIKPLQFRKIVARGNAEFSSTRQQDADEYIRYRKEGYIKEIDAFSLQFSEVFKGKGCCNPTSMFRLK